jgi:hypothetical protein
LKIFRVVADDLISKATVLIIVLILTTGTISLGGSLVFASGINGDGDGGTEGSGGETGGGDGGVEEGSSSADPEVDQDPDTGDEVSDDNSNTEGVGSEQDSACPEVAFEGPSYLDEKGCPAPCPPLSDVQDANIPEGCPQPLEGPIPEGTLTPEEQIAQPADAVPPPVGVPLGGHQPPLIGPPADNATLTQQEPQVAETCMVTDETGENPMQVPCINMQHPGPPPESQTSEEGGESDASGLDGEVRDIDLDGDAYLGTADNCPFAANRDQTDSDGDGQGDACDGDITDYDKDTVVDSKDNCMTVGNPAQTDSDGDGEGDACEGTIEFGGGGPSEAPFIPPK